TTRWRFSCFPPGGPLAFLAGIGRVSARGIVDFARDLLRMDAGAGRDLPPFADVAADALAYRRGRAGLAFHALRHECRFAVGRTENFIHLAIEARDDRRWGGRWHDE